MMSYKNHFRHSHYVSTNILATYLFLLDIYHKIYEVNIVTID